MTRFVFRGHAAMLDSILSVRGGYYLFGTSSCKLATTSHPGGVFSFSVRSLK